MSEVRTSRTLVDLDSLFDTRLGTIGLYNADLLKTILEANNHHLRTCESYGTLKFDEFKAIYDKRDKLTLSKSLPTGMQIFLDHIITETKKTAIDNPTCSIPELVINSFPYNLTEEEENNIIATASTSFRCPVKIVNLPLEAITPRLLAKEYDSFIIYSYYEWLEIHSKSELFKKERCPDVAMFVPAISFNDPNVTVPADFFERLEIMTSPIIGLRFLPISHFSVFIEV